MTYSKGCQLIEHEGKDVGGWDTVIKREEYERMFYNQQATMTIADAIEESEIEEEPVKPTPITPYKSPVTVTPLVADKESKFGTSTKSASTTVTKPSDDFVMPELAEGMSVVHGKFGNGTIVKVFANAKKITVKFSIGEKDFVTDVQSDMNAFRRGFLKIHE